MGAYPESVTEHAVPFNEPYRARHVAPASAVASRPTPGPPHPGSFHPGPAARLTFLPQPAAIPVSKRGFGVA